MLYHKIVVQGVNNTNLGDQHDNVTYSWLNGQTES